MAKEIKLIWDFRGAEAEKIADHHAKHLREYAATNNMDQQSIGAEALSPMHSIAFIIVNQDKMIPVRDALKPHRGEYLTS